jgi:probable phosphoglycerate mutase
MSAGTLWFLRHGETEPNRAGLRCGGDNDVPLTMQGEATAREMAQTLAHHGIALIITSPLQRTRRTAEIISAALGNVPIEFDADLSERLLAQWNGLSIRETEPLLRQGIAPPGGETAEAFAARVRQALARIRKRLSSSVLVVSSKGVARVFNEAIGNANRAPAANGEVIEYRFPAG